MMRYLKLLLVLAIVFTLFTSCTKYRYGDQTFTDRSKADAAYKDVYAKRLAAISPRKASLAKYAKVIIPNKAVTLERGVTTTGTNDGRDYVAASLYDGNYMVGEMIRKRNIFEKVDIISTPDPGHVSPPKDEVIIYLYVPDRTSAGWYYISDKTKRTPLNFDRGNPDIDGRYKYFIESIEALAAGE
jgi:hypothetical protein